MNTPIQNNSLTYVRCYQLVLGSKSLNIIAGEVNNQMYFPILAPVGFSGNILSFLVKLLSLHLAQPFAFTFSGNVMDPFLGIS